MKKRRQKIDLTDATYLDGLGTSSARTYAEVIERQVRDAGIPLPLPDHDVGALLDNTVRGLGHQGLVDWSKTPDIRRSVFVNAWLTEMSRLGIRS